LAEISSDLLIEILNKIQDRLSAIERKVDELKAEMPAMRGHMVAIATGHQQHLCHARPA
jgi:hypothetical protein